ncbi:glycosyltransferase [Methylomonas albis]|uniref:Glycosyltransferase n=1 Tax=Methylomonas albis TaxID=1854563 RepID=A0ABR9CYW3_9GAMM|nr:glycosyltransferase [Methylomonas albis]MBD9356067.1 glycosyltransferase [Methylomonas albis]
MSKIKLQHQKRIFWLGMHKVLVETEFPMLKKMGYEVFRPPYLSNIQDQSVSDKWEVGDTTLPRNVLNKLCRYNFFYNSISHEIGEILNTYFDVVIVTIHPDWLLSVLKVFSGTVLYRCYGQIGIVSKKLYENGAFDLIQGRENFWFLPHANECLSDEQIWLQNVGHVVPYWLTDDVLDLKDTWATTEIRRQTIALSCPNITNAYYQTHFRYLKEFFEQRKFRYYGVQLEPNADPNVVGTLSRAAFLSEFSKESGYIYTYRERNVCYLPPIEMMMLGGPVLYFPNSLLHRYFGFNSPGLVKNEEDALRVAQLIINGDKALISEIIDSQESIRRRYLKEYGQPIFENTIKALLESSSSSVTPKIIYDLNQQEIFDYDPVLILSHFKNTYVHCNGLYSSIEETPRVMQQFVKALNLKDIPVMVTALENEATVVHGFYAAECASPDLVKVIPLSELGIYYLENASNRFIKSLINGCGNRSNEHFLRILDTIKGKRKIRNIKSFYRLIKSILTYLFLLFQNIIIAYVASKKISKLFSSISPKLRYAVVPHYYNFPEAISLNAPLLAYIPDYIPHFFTGRECFPKSNKNVAIGVKLAKKAKKVLTDSAFSKEYLPNSALKVPADKIVSFLTPYFGASNKQNDLMAIPINLIQKLDGRKFVFYPAQYHPNKRLDLLVRSWCLAVKSLPELFLVLTASFIPEVSQNEIRSNGLLDKLFIFNKVNDTTLAWLYKNASCLGYSSEMEGNFPTQLLDALINDCPIVCMDNPLIRFELCSYMELLLHAPFADVGKFAELILHAIEYRNEVLDNQNLLKNEIIEHFSFQKFAANVYALDTEMANYEF